jgi:formate/nitrite transporter FocA (FNT family)
VKEFILIIIETALKNKFIAINFLLMVRNRMKKFELLFLLILLIIYLSFNHSNRKTEINNINELSPKSIYIILFWTKFYLHPFIGNTSEDLKCNLKILVFLLMIKML